jgi:LysM repeat protein
MAKYTVTRGDNLTKIARRFGISLANLIRANPQIRDPDLILVGQEIEVPVPVRHPPPSPGPTLGDIYGPGAVSRTDNPREDTRYVERAIAAVGIPIWGGPFHLYRQVVNGRGTNPVVFQRTDAQLTNDPLQSAHFEIRVVYGSLAAAQRAVE